MQPRQPDNAIRSDSEANQPLPTRLATQLEPGTRHALMHGMRRRILRAFAESATARTTQDLLTAFPGAGLSSVNYHVLVLCECGSLTVSRVEQARGSLTRSFVSTVADDPQIVAVLRATEQLDDVC